MQNPAADSRPTMLSDADMDDAEVLAPIGAAGATPTVDEPSMCEQSHGGTVEWLGCQKPPSQTLSGGGWRTSTSR